MMQKVFKKLQNQEDDGIYFMNLYKYSGTKIGIFKALIERESLSL
jgi:hypothetical protein